MTEQYYLKARFYNPAVARFTQEDTYYGDGLNLYAYCHNNPVSYVDPTGHEARAAAEKNPGSTSQRTPDQQALFDLVDEQNKLGGHDSTDQKTIRDWADAYGVDYDDLGVKLKESGTNTATTIDYSYKFDRELANFNDGYEIRTTVDKDLILVQYSSDAPDASLCYWTTVDEANGITTLNDYMDKLALSKDWGNRNTVKVARISAGTEVKYAVGTAREQLLIADPRPGGGVQYLFNQFDTDWITEIRSFSN